MKLANILKTLKIIKTKAASENNKEQQLSEGFANSCYKIVSPVLLQALTNDFAIYKHCITTPSLVKDVTSSHDFGN